MKRPWFILAFVFLLPLVILSCGGGGSGGGDPLAALEGTWLGKTSAGNTISLDVDGSGNLTAYRLNGLPTPLLATITQIDGPVFLYEWSSMFTTSFLTDGNGENALMIDTTPPFVIENSVAFNPNTWVREDIIGTWEGYGYAYTGGSWQTYEPVEFAVSQLLNVLLFTANLPSGVMEGVAGTVDMANGVWSAVALDNTAIDIYMTIHEDFIGVSVEPPGGAVVDEDYVYWALRRQ